MSENKSPRVSLAQWINEQPQALRDQLLEQINLVQSWINEFARALGKKRAPKARITDHALFYAPWSNVIAIPAKMLLEADGRQLRIAVAHECGHFSRRWKSLFSRTDFARLCEEVHADRVAMALTGATLDDLDAVVRQLAGYEESWSPEALETYVDQRRSLLQSLETSVPAR